MIRNACEDIFQPIRCVRSLRLAIDSVKHTTMCAGLFNGSLDFPGEILIRIDVALVSPRGDAGVGQRILNSNREREAIEPRVTDEHMFRRNIRRFT
jgi:hypothetical protein